MGKQPSSEDSQQDNQFSDGLEGVSISRIITAAFSAILGILICLIKKAWNKVKDSTVGYAKRKVYGFFNWEKPSSHSLNNAPKTKENKQFDIRTCCICLENITLPVMSACDHPFCGQCIVLLWENKNKQKLSCPYCRRDMNLLYKDFEESAVQTNEDKKIINQLKDYNQKFSGHKRTLLETIKDAPFLWKVMFEKITTFRNFWFVFKNMISSGRLIAAVIYILSPFDLLPEAILGPIGLIDDAGALGYVLLTIANISFQLLRRID